MVTNNPESLGPWEHADLQGTAYAFSGDGSDNDIETVHRFSRSVCRLVLRRLRQPEQSVRRDAIAIFLLQPTAPDGYSTIREPLLGDGGVEVCGKIWFANATAQSGRSLAVDCQDDGTMFEIVESLDLGDIPTVVFNPKVAVPVVRIYSQGVNVDNVVAIDIDEHEVNLSEIKEIIDLMCEKELCTPDAQQPGLSMWANAPQFWAASNAESIAQLHTKTALSVRLFKCDIRREQTMRIGRSDLEIAQRLADGRTVIPAEIEIKVLRERNRKGKRWSDRYVEKWMRRGVRQAAAYRDERNADSGVLCCFDMRGRDRGDLAAFSIVRDYADSNSVVLHRNFLYNSSEAQRVAVYGD